MKCLIMIFVVMFGIAFSQNDAFARSGSAVIPYYVGGGNITHYLPISNISNDMVSIKLTYYKADGSILFDSGNSSTTGIIKITRGSEVAGTYNEPSTNNSITFNLAAKQSIIISIYSASILYEGYGVIEWYQDPSTAVDTTPVHALVASGVESTSYTTYTINVNNGLPF